MRNIDKNKLETAKQKCSVPVTSLNNLKDRLTDMVKPHVPKFAVTSANIAVADIFQEVAAFELAIETDEQLNADTMKDLLSGTKELITKATSAWKTLENFIDEAEHHVDDAEHHAEGIEHHSDGS